MSKRLQNQIFILISTLLAVVFIYILYTKVDKEKTLNALSEADYLWLIISMILGVVSYELRARRWNILFEPMHIRVKNKSAFWTIAFAYFMNLTIPRSGEIARATSLYSLEKVPVEKSLGTIFSERLIDLLLLLGVLVLTLLFSPQPFYAFMELAQQSQSESKGFPIWVWVLLGLALGVLLLLFIFRNKIKKWKGYARMMDILKGFKEGVFSILKIRHKVAFVLYSLGIWVCYFLMTYLVIFSFEATENLPWNYGLFLLIAGSFGMIFPATGGLAYPLVMRYAFGAIFISLGKGVEQGYDAGSYFGISLYLAQIFTVVLMGIISIMYISKSKITERKIRK